MKKSYVLVLLLFFIYAPQIAKSQVEIESYTYKLSQSNLQYELWTSLASERIFKNAAVPTSNGEDIKVYAAKNEFEPFLLIVKPKSSGNITINIDDFGSGIGCEIYQVKYVNITQATDNLGQIGDYPDPLWPIEKGSSISVNANENTAFWFSLNVSASASSGDKMANISIGGISVPIKLHVFNFAIPEELHVKSQMNFSHNTILNKYGVSGTGDNYWMYVDKMKQYFIDHRLTPKGSLWSGGLTSGGAPYIEYDCNGTFSDPHGVWGFEIPADKYLNGNGFNNGTGFPSFMAMTFKNNDASADQRPSEFCGQMRNSSDWYTGNNPNSAYNQKWFNYVGAIQNYLSSLGYLDKSYYYFANEPQDQTDYDAVAWYSQELKKAAPNLKLMISEEPKSEIYNHPTYTDAKVDIWLSVLNKFNPEISNDRAKNYNEDTWIYFLHGTRPPYFNPITLDHSGIESKFTGWFLWKYRLKGIAYYSLNNWSKNPWTDPMTSNHNGDVFMLYPPSENNTNISYGANNHRFVPSIRFELMRESLEDYEYLYLMNGSKQPKVEDNTSIDNEVNKIISGLTSYTRDSEFMYNLRRHIGYKVENPSYNMPNIQPQTLHPRTQGNPGNYYINFQDPNGEPMADPLIVNSKEYMKIGWNAYDEVLGYGWFGDFAHVKYQYYGVSNELQKSIIYDDFGREKVFEFDLPNGIYNVTVSIGWYNKTYSHNKIDVEGVSFVNDEATTPEQPNIVRTKSVTILDHKLTMDMGIFDEYTMLNFVEIEAVPLSVKQIENNLYEFDVYPNPSTEIVTLSFAVEKQVNAKFIILNLMGEIIDEISEQDFNKGNYQINWIAPENGVYFIKLLIDNKVAEVKKCIFVK